MQRTPSKTSKPPAAKAKTAKQQATSSKIAKMETPTSPSPSKLPIPPPVPLPLPPNVTKLIRQRSDIMPPKQELDSRAEKHYDAIIENLNKSGNIKSTIKENINFHATKLYHMLDSINCEMTDLAREVLAAVMERLDQTPVQVKQQQETEEIKNKLDQFLEQVKTQNLELKQEILDLKTELRIIKEEKSNNKMVEEIQKQNILSEKTQKDLQEIKEEIKAIPTTQPTLTEKPIPTPASYSQALQQPYPDSAEK
ncbi:unnamed protein product, partial [Brenthis ino]